MVSLCVPFGVIAVNRTANTMQNFRMSRFSSYFHGILVFLTLFARNDFAFGVFLMALLKMKSFFNRKLSKWDSRCCIVACMRHSDETTSFEINSRQHLVMWAFLSDKWPHSAMWFVWNFYASKIITSKAANTNAVNCTGTWLKCHRRMLR